MIANYELNNDAERATVAVMKRTSLLLGQMKMSMEIIYDATRYSNLEESGQLELARKKLENLNLLESGTINTQYSNSPFQGIPQLKDLQLDFNKLPE